jgi:hypothetical protein
MAELQISVAKVCEIIEAARELAGRIPPTTGDHTTTGDDSPLVFLEEADDDPTRDELTEAIAGLNFEEQADLLALIYLGRGDFDLAGWEDALDQAKTEIEDGDADFMVGDAALASYLGDALEAFGKSCDEI